MALEADSAQDRKDVPLKGHLQLGLTRHGKKRRGQERCQGECCESFTIHSGFTFQRYR